MLACAKITWFEYSLLGDSRNSCHFSRFGDPLVCPVCKVDSLGRYKMVRHYGARHGRILDFVDEDVKRKLEGMGVKKVD